MAELDKLKSIFDKVEQLETKMKRLMYGTCRLCGEPLTGWEQRILQGECLQCFEETAD